jgi:hypothetical protein
MECFIFKIQADVFFVLYKVCKLNNAILFSAVLFKLLVGSLSRCETHGIPWIVRRIVNQDSSTEAGRFRSAEILELFGTC